MEFMNSRKEYLEVLMNVPPTQAVSVVNDRVKRIGKLNLEIADWFQERRKLENIYAQGLKKLARRPQPQDDASSLGTFLSPWQKIVNAAQALAASHELLAQRIEADVERPLKEFLSKDPEMQTLSASQGNLAALAKDYESACERADKLGKKGAKAAPNKVAKATDDVEQATRQWKTGARTTFEGLQLVDESRLNLLRDVLTQFQTHELDQVERERTSAEDCLNILLNIEAGDEIGAFVARIISGKAKGEPQSSRTATNSTISAPTGSIPFEDGRSQKSGVSAAHTRGEAGQETRSDRFGGLKRLGTVMTRRKSTATSGRGISPEKRPRSDSNSKDIPPIPAIGFSQSGSTSLFSDEERARLPLAELSTSSPHIGHTRTANDTNGDLGDSADLTKATSPSPVYGSSVKEEKVLQRTDSESSPSAFATGSLQPRQEELASPAPLNDPISQAQHEASSESAQNVLKLDIRNAPIQEEEDDAQTAMANVANTLRAQAAQSRRPGTQRGRRDVRNTIFVPSPQAPDLGLSDSPNLLPPSKHGKPPALPSEDHAGSDTQSVRSSQSLNTSSALSVIKHSEMLGEGLNSSVVEIVSAWLDHGRVTKATVTGEMALSYNPIDTTKASTSETVRLENFPVLEKVAPNPAFISPIPEKSGEYLISLNNAIRRSVAFKYQVHLDESSVASQAPIVATPSWKLEPTQASVILNYSLNPAFNLPRSKSLTLHNVVFIIHLEGAKPSACQSKPVGTFLRERALLYWKLGDITLEAGGSLSRLLARFVTDVQAKPGSIEVRWEVGGEDARGLGSQLALSQLASPPNKQTATSAPQDDPFADDSSRPTSGVTWKDVPVVRRLVSGTYVAK
ncbi:MAG: hypothetical protein M1816_003914 [Peltula sp. TS41687]|nr:MAG: hypothetical protein M1816_003914 [Peltula sp. TS41687]